MRLCSVCGRAVAPDVVPSETLDGRLELHCEWCRRAIVAGRLAVPREIKENRGMSGSVNVVLLVGRVGKDPEIRYTQAGDPIAHLSLATSERWMKDGERKERTEWHRVEVFGKPAQFVRDYVTKGALLSVEGSIRYEEWADKEGRKQRTTKIRARNVTALARGGERTQEEPQKEFEASDEDVPF